MFTSGEGALQVLISKQMLLCEVSASFKYLFSAVPVTQHIAYIFFRHEGSGVRLI